MKRSFLLIITCICALSLGLFGLAACGGGDGSSGSVKPSTSTSADDGSGEGSTIDPEAYEDAHSIFEQVLANMSEFYKGTTPVGEQLYYAGGANGSTAIFAIIVPETNTSMIFMGAANVEEGTNKLTVNDETTGAYITFQVISNDDGTISFSMGEEYGSAVMVRCSSGEIADVLAELVANAPSSQSTEGDGADASADSQE